MNLMNNTIVLDMDTFQQFCNKINGKYNKDDDLQRARSTELHPSYAELEHNLSNHYITKGGRPGFVRIIFLARGEHLL